MQRIPKSNQHLKAFIKKRLKTPFQWGKNDCALFVADAVLAQTDHDIAKAFRGKYKTELGAAKALKKIGKGDLRKTLVFLLGKETSLLNAKIGDVAIFIQNEEECAGIVYYGGIFTTGKEGLVSLPLSQAITILGLD